MDFVMFLSLDDYETLTIILFLFFCATVNHENCATITFMRLRAIMHDKILAKMGLHQNIRNPDQLLPSRPIRNAALA